MKSKWLSCLLAVCVLFSIALPALAQQKDDIRAMVMGLDEKVTLEDGTEITAINFDNAATTPALLPVFEEVQKQLLVYGSIGRGAGQKSEHSSQVYEAGRKMVLSFVGATSDQYTMFYVGNTTDGLNKLSSALITSPEDIVLTSRMEHHANDLPWRHRGKTIYAEVDGQGRLKLEDMERLLKENEGKVKLVSVTAASNVTGYVNDVHAIAKLAHQYGAQIVVDGAQIVAHRRFSMVGGDESQNIDYFVFSAHKMYAPFGSGAVVGLKEELNQHMPMFYGGGIVDLVADQRETYLDAPERYEAGTPNYLGVVAMAKAMEVLNSVGFDYIEEHEQRLLRKTIDGLRAIPGITLYGDTDNIADKVGIVVFNVDGMFHGETSRLLAQRYGVATRHAAFCSHPYVFRLLGVPDEEITAWMDEDPSDDDNVRMPGMVRVSFGIYNTEEEVDAFLKAVGEIAATR